MCIIWFKTYSYPCEVDTVVIPFIDDEIDSLKVTELRQLWFEPRQFDPKRPHTKCSFLASLFQNPHGMVLFWRSEIRKEGNSC